MINYIKYALSKYLQWLGLFALVIGVVAIIPINQCIAICVVIGSFVLSFLIPFVQAIFRREFKLRTIGKSNLSFKFGDLFDEECMVITTNCYFDVNPTGDYIAEDSLLGGFVERFFHNNVSQLENLISTELQKIEGQNSTGKFDYGTWIKIKYSGKIIYFLAFTDRNKTDQPSNFYEKSIKTFLETIVNENHGKTISVPIFGDNNNLSDSGFSCTETAFKSFIAMVNSFEIVNQRSELKLRIVALPEKQAELISVLKAYSK